MTTQQPDQAHPDESLKPETVREVAEDIVRHGKDSKIRAWALTALDLLDQLNKAREQAANNETVMQAALNDLAERNQQLEAAQARDETTKPSMASIEKRDAKRENEYMVLKRQLNALFAARDEG